MSAVNGAVPARHLNLHEYQSKRLMEQYGCNTQRFKIAASTREAQTATSELGIYGESLVMILGERGEPCGFGDD